MNAVCPPAHAQELFGDDFNGSSLNTCSWYVETRYAYPQHRTQWGNNGTTSDGAPQLLPESGANKFVRLQLDTRNPLSNNLWGAQIRTYRQFDPPTAGRAVEFEARVRMNIGPGVVSAFWTHNDYMRTDYPNPDGACGAGQQAPLAQAQSQSAASPSNDANQFKYWWRNGTPGTDEAPSFYGATKDGASGQVATAEAAASATPLPNHRADEIDFEWVGGNAAGARPNNDVQLTTWNNWEVTDNPYYEHWPYNSIGSDGQQHHCGAFTSVTAIPYDRSQWFYYKIKWLRAIDSTLHVEWYVRAQPSGTWTKITAPSNALIGDRAVPDERQRLLFNIWAPNSAWQEAYNANISANQSNPQTYTLDVDWVRVRQVDPGPDSAAPVVTVATPSYDQAANAITAINGTVSDPGASQGINRVELFIRSYYQGVPHFWNGNGWQPNAVAVLPTAISGNTWSYNPVNGLLPNSNTASAGYTASGYIDVHAYAYDESGKMGSSLGRFIMDGKAPTVTISSPVNNSWVSAMPPVYGTAADPGADSGSSGPNVALAPGSGISRVEVTIDAVLDSITGYQYWDGSGWRTSRFVLPVTLNGNTWSYNGAMPSLTQGYRSAITVSATAYDGAGYTATATSSFRIDTAQPTVTISAPSYNAVGRLMPAVSGTSSDTSSGSGIDHIDLYVNTVYNGVTSYWNSAISSWSTVWIPPMRVAVSPTGAWSYTGPLPSEAQTADSFIDIQAFALDRANNVSQGAAGRFILDSTAPYLNITTPADNSVVRGSAPITGTVSEPNGDPLGGSAPGSGLNRVGLYINHWYGGERYYWTGSQWIKTWVPPLATTVTNGAWSYNGALPTGGSVGAGAVIDVQAESLDFAGNTRLVEKHYRIDDAPPTVSITSQSPSSRVAHINTLSGAVADVGPAGAREVRVAVTGPNGASWNGSGWVQGGYILASFGGGSWSCAGPPLSQLVNNLAYAIRASAFDHAGNTATATVAGVVVDKEGPVISNPEPTPNSSLTTLNSGVRIQVTDPATPAGATLWLRKYSDTHAGLYWNGTAWVSAASPLAMSYNSTLARWVVIGSRLPTGSNLSLGGYRATVNATDGVGNVSEYFTWQFSIVASGSTATNAAPEGPSLDAAPSEGVDSGEVQVPTDGAQDEAEAEVEAPESPVRLSSASFDAASSTLSLKWTGPLDPDYATDALSYMAWIGEWEVAVESATYDTATHTVRLVLPEDAAAGAAEDAEDFVGVQWLGLRDVQGRPIPQSSWEELASEPQEQAAEEGLTK